jgi:hypothetical protein
MSSARIYALALSGNQMKGSDTWVRVYYPRSTHFRGSFSNLQAS